jgi:hypothetical protein
LENAHGISRLVAEYKREVAGRLPVTILENKDDFDLRRHREDYYASRQSTSALLKDFLQKEGVDDYSNDLYVKKVVKRQDENDYEIEFNSAKVHGKAAVAYIKSNQDPCIRALAQLNFGLCWRLSDINFFEDTGSEVKLKM